MTSPLLEDPAFAHAYAIVRAHEGGFSNDPDDPGGATKWGISLRWLAGLGDDDGDGFLDGDFDLDGDVDVADLRAMTEDQAAALYHDRWWRRFGYGRFDDLAVASKAFDLAVNMGARPAHRILQRAVRAAGGAALIDDGIVGPATLGAINHQGPEFGHDLRVAMRSEAAGHYRLLIARRPAFAKYERGWLNRAYA